MSGSFLHEAVHGGTGIIGFELCDGNSGDQQCPFYFTDEEAQALWRADLPHYLKSACGEMIRSLDPQDSTFDPCTLFVNVYAAWSALIHASLTRGVQRGQACGVEMNAVAQLAAKLLQT